MLRKYILLLYYIHYLISFAYLSFIHKSLRLLNEWIIINKSNHIQEYLFSKVFCCHWSDVLFQQLLTNAINLKREVFILNQIKSHKKFYKIQRNFKEIEIIYILGSGCWKLKNYGEQRILTNGNNRTNCERKN